MSLRRYATVKEEELAFQIELDEIRRIAGEMIREHRTENLNELRVRGDTLIASLQKLRDERLVLERRLARGFVDARPRS